MTPSVLITPAKAGSASRPARAHQYASSVASRASASAARLFMNIATTVASSSGRVRSPCSSPAGRKSIVHERESCAARAIDHAPADRDVDVAAAQQQGAVAAPGFFGVGAVVFDLQAELLGQRRGHHHQRQAVAGARIERLRGIAGRPPRRIRSSARRACIATAPASRRGSESTARPACCGADSLRIASLTAKTSCASIGCAGGVNDSSCSRAWACQRVPAAPVPQAATDKANSRAAQPPHHQDSSAHHAPR